MRLVCPNEEAFDVQAAELVLVREDVAGGVYIHAYLILTSETDVVDDLMVQAEPLTVSADDPLVLSAARIISDSGLIQVFKEELLNSFPQTCACGVGGECFGLASASTLGAGLRTVGG